MKFTGNFHVTTTYDLELSLTEEEMGYLRGLLSVVVSSSLHFNFGSGALNLYEELHREMQRVGDGI